MFLSNVERNNTRMQVTVYPISYTIVLPSWINCKNESLTYDALPDGIIEGSMEGSSEGTKDGWSEGISGLESNVS